MTTEPWPSLDDLKTELAKLRAHITKCHEFQNNVAAVLEVPTDWDDEGRKTVEYAVMRAVGNLTEARRDLDAMRPRANGAARELADLRDELATSRKETEDARELYGFAASDRDEMSVKIDDLTAERDALQARLDAALAVHSEFKIYDECGHRHEYGEPGVKSIDNVGLTCEDGYEYSICRECSTDGSEEWQSEVCAEHDHVNCWPCKTHRALKGETQ